jgi:UPF0716 protein FxsA
MSSPYRVVLFLCFVAVPFIELALLIKTGQSIGVWPTLALLILAGCAGATLLHWQGTAAVRRIFSGFDHGTLPVESVMDGAMIILAGALLLTPGFLTDVAGLLLLIPPVRAVFRRMVFSHVLNPEHTANPGSETRSERRQGSPVIIETEFKRLNEKTIDPDGRQRK